MARKYGSAFGDERGNALATIGRSAELAHCIAFDVELLLERVLAAAANGGLGQRESPGRADRKSLGDRIPAVYICVLKLLSVSGRLSVNRAIPRSRVTEIIVSTGSAAAFSVLVRISIGFAVPVAKRSNSLSDAPRTNFFEF